MSILRRSEWSKADTMLAVNTLFLGVGKCGGAIANRIQRRGYKSFYINTAVQDLKELENVTKEQIFPISEAGGCNQNRNMAKEIIAENAPEINRVLENRYAGYDHYVICFSLGGGTGSGMSPTLAQFMLSQDKKVSMIVVLPPKNENRIPVQNSYECLGEIEELLPYLSNVYILDNSNMSSKEDINEMIAEQIDNIYSLAEHTMDQSEVNGLKPADDTENLALVTAQGVVHIARINNPTKSDDEKSPYVIKDLECMVTPDANKWCSNMAVSLAYGSMGDFKAENLYKYFGRPDTVVKIGINPSDTSYAYIFGKDIPQHISDTLLTWLDEFKKEAGKIQKDNKPKFTKKLDDPFEKKSEAKALDNPFANRATKAQTTSNPFDKPNPFARPNPYASAQNKQDSQPKKNPFGL